MKKTTKNQKTKPEYILPVKKCMGHPCKYARYVQHHPDDKYMYLTCGLKNIETLKLERCPKGLWQKDAKGFPVRGK